MADTCSEESKDTSPLEPGQLSDDELTTIFEIERRLNEAKQTDVGKDPQGVELYLAMVQRRHPRVLLLDGGRGTGKTSLLLTLVERWHLDTKDDPEFRKERARITDAYKERLKSFPGERNASCIPSYVRVLDILDFDPLAPGMPLIAGIMQAWRPLAEQYDRESGRPDEYNDENPRLMDFWHCLFRMAAVGWGKLPQNKGLIEQVLDREDQVQDWQRLDEHWRSFVTKVIETGRKLKSVHKLGEDTVFVIMIDDVDLQVGRIRELLPALRLLYHPRVMFLVAADRQHMIHMLKLDFYGQQSELARHGNANGPQAIELAGEGWAGDLATSAFEKVFPTRNRMKLAWLSISDFLAFPGQAATKASPAEESLPSEEESKEPSRSDSSGSGFLADLKNFRWISASNSSTTPLNAGQLILDFAQTAVQARLPGIMTYRAAEQLWQYVAKFSENPARRAAEVLARLLSGNGEADKAVVQLDSETIDVQITGELAALYRPGPTVFGGTFDVVLSARPDFVFLGPADSLPRRMSTEPENRFNFVAAMIAKILHEATFSVDASGLRWETYLSHAWTEWSLSPRLAFAWTRHAHPRPDKLFMQTRQWAEFIKLPSEQKDELKLERYAYAWVYFQRQWSDWPAGEKATCPTKLGGSTDSLPWEELLDFGKLSDSRESRKWRYETLPLLARPELGFPPSVQKRLLEEVLNSGGRSAIESLRRERRRLATDAFAAASMQRGKILREIPEDPVIDAVLAKIDKIYKDVHPNPSPWIDIENSSALGTGESERDESRS